MPSTLIGEAVVFAMDNRTVAFSGVATTQNEPTGLNLRDSFDKADVKGRDGRTISRGAANRRHTITVEITFKDTAGSPTRASADAVAKLPAKFGIVTLAAFNNSLFDGDWNYEDGTIAHSANGEAKATLTLARMEKADGSMGAMTAVA